MKKVKKADSKPKRKPAAPKQPGIRVPAAKQKKSGQVLPDRKNRDIKQARLEALVWNLDKSCETMEVKIHQQTDELKVKNGQLQQQADLQDQSDEQIQILTKAIESTTDGIFIIAAQKQKFPIVFTNSAFRTMTGYPKSEIAGRDYFTLYRVEADSRVIAEIKATLKRGEYFHGELLNYKKNGHSYWSRLRISPVRSISGTITHYVGIQTDISLIRERELEVKEQREELLHVTRVGKLAEFVSSLAHEISQPLTAILSYAQAARRLLSDREQEIQEILQYIISDNQRAVEVIRRLRTLLKKSEPEIKLLDINAVINETIILISADAVIRNCVITVELAQGIPMVRGDLIQLQQVLLNLFSNSFDAMENVQDPRTIVVRTLREDQHAVRVEVVDTGCGIPLENMPKLFSRFFTSKPDGLGMGLSISRSIVEAHGGYLQAQNNPDRGATFYFTLPITKED